MSEPTIIVESPDGRPYVISEDGERRPLEQDEESEDE